MKKNRITTIILVFIFLAGFCLLLYPKFSNYWNSLHQTRAVNHYIEAVKSLDEEKCAELFSVADEYNRLLNERANVFSLPDSLKTRYSEMLNISGDGVMGYIDIPSINVSLPVYHGTSHAVLQKAVGHLDWTSLPAGGESTHCVLSGHRGLPSSKLFTDLDRLAVGDLFCLNVLNQTLYYRVDKVLIVDPSDVSSLVVHPGKDYCTLVTCTPYGVNTHRLLVIGERAAFEGEAESVYVSTDAILVEPVMVAPVIFVCILLTILFCITAARYIRTPRRKK